MSLSFSYLSMINGPFVGEVVVHRRLLCHVVRVVMHGYIDVTVNFGGSLKKVSTSNRYHQRATVAARNAPTVRQ